MSRLLLVVFLGAHGCTSKGGGDDVGASDSDGGTQDGDSGQPDDSGDGDDTGEGCLGGDPYVEIGTGEDGYEALTSGDPLMMVHGPQGGWHVLGSVRIWNMEPIVNIHFVVTSPTHDAIVADNTYRVATVTETECTGLFWGMYGYLDVHEIADGDNDTPPELLSYLDLEVSMTVTDMAGVETVSTMMLKAVPDPQDVEEEVPSKR